jgi:anti-sigma regulatory factor (Ser/Thr protein kinase)
MNTETHSIIGGNYEEAGVATSILKKRLKRIGVDPQIVRRAVIAAYEAEANVAIHARKGRMDIKLDRNRLHVEVTDQGPGIPDIDQAMREGFSTAPVTARELGFGAGMGLPNIRKNSDLFAIESTVGEGTQVRFTVYLDTQHGCHKVGLSVRIVPEFCRECLHCMRSCPTQALRVLGGKPLILEHLCIDCAACIGICGTGALALHAATSLSAPYEDAALIVHPALLVQLGGAVGPQQALAALAEIGFRDVRVTEEWESALRDGVMEYAFEEAKGRPVISPVCPAVVNLVEMRFPSLMENLAPFRSPVEALCEELAGNRIVLSVLCPSMRTAVMSLGVEVNVEMIAPSTLRQELTPLVNRIASEGSDVSKQHDGARGCSHMILQVSGIRHVMNVLERAENGLLGDVRVVEPFACDHGCFGSPLLSEEAFVAAHRWSEAGYVHDTTAKAVRRAVPFCARTGMRLDEDMSKAIEKLSRIDETAKSLPGKDCGMCGAPTCVALAEDIVLGRAAEGLCLHLARSEEKAG